jgi:hypothetical protein
MQEQNYLKNLYPISPYDTEIITSKAKEFGEEELQDKFWQGLVIEADTFGANKTLKFYDDDGILKATIIINHSGKIIKSYSFDIPFISHKITRLSDDNIEWIPYNEKYIYDLEPELAKVWESQRTSLGLNGFKQIKNPVIALASTSDVVLKLIVDNEALVDYTIPSTGGIKKSYNFQIKAKKWKLIRFRLESTGKFRFYKEDFELAIREWNSQNDFQVIKPFGALDNQTGVQI